VREVAPYGSWASPIGIEPVVESGGVVFGAVDATADGSYWHETRPAEAGRSVLVYATLDGATEDVVPRDFNVRTRVHEYGGGAWWRHGETIFCSRFEDSRVYRLDRRGAEPRPITPEPSAPNAFRFADGRVTRDGRLVVCVRETHGDGEPQNDLVVFPADGSEEPRTIASGSDFYASPRPSPDGTKLVWQTWNHPQMPFEGTELWLADFAQDGTLSNERRFAGSRTESIVQPEWRDDGVLHFVSDRTGWWNLYRLDGDEVRALYEAEAEFGFPPWVFDLSTYAFLPDGRIACTVIRKGVGSLELLDPDARTLERVDLPYTVYYSPSIRAHGTRLVFAAGSPLDPIAVVSYDLARGERTILRRSMEETIDERYVSRPETLEFPTEGGKNAYAFFYPPTNGDFEGPADELPPLLVHVHGGPTAQTFALLGPDIQFWTSRGIAVVDVNYGGSTGYGREYRDRLRRRWGIADLDDAIAAARFLADSGRVDPARLVIKGGSAGGYTTLLAIATRDVFTAGISEFGVTDLIAFRADTHKFEKYYDEYLVGPYEEELYRERSPITHADGLSAPLLLLQGRDDEIVPPSQSELMIEALERKGIPYAYLAFEGEGHGFRKAENRRRALEAELDFLARILGFEPADEVEPVDIKNLAAASR
jgi:dipeptidyl aminopeptidase/acylaminoacyl peptidase